MSTATATRTALREVILAALDDAYEYRRAQVDDCRDCARQPAGICLDHQGDNDAAFDYEAARKQIEGTLAGPDTAAELAALLGTEEARS